MGGKKKFYQGQVRRSLLKIWFEVFPLMPCLIFFYCEWYTFSQFYGLSILLGGGRGSEGNKKLC